MEALAVHVIGVDGDAEVIAEQLATAGHTVSGPMTHPIDQLADAIAQAPGADAVVVVADTGPGAGAPDAVMGALQVVLPGVGELARRVAFDALGAQAAMMRPLGGKLGEHLVFLVPSEAVVAKAVVEQVVLQLLPAAAPPAIEPVSPPTDDDVSVTDAAADDLPAPVATRTSQVGLAASHEIAEAPDATEPEAVPDRGWKRAVADLNAEVFVGKHEELPEPIEKLAPVVNVLQSAGEFGMMKLPSGRRYGLYGWPDLRRANAKVLAISWGDPLAEVVALHRYPDQAGTLIPGKLGMLPSQDRDPFALSEKITGREAPTEGKVFAMDTGTVWVLSGRRVLRWDGSRERDDGSPKQVLASLALHWSSR